MRNMHILSKRQLASSSVEWCISGLLWIVREAPQEAGVVLVSAPLFKRLASIHSLKHYSELGFPVGQWELNSVPITSTAAVIAAALS